MAKVIDLNTIVKDNLEFVLLDGKKVVIPGQVTTQFVLELSRMEEKSKNVKHGEEIDILIDIVTLILQQDKNAGITREYVVDNLTDIGVLKAIIENMLKHIAEITSDENL